jgi:HlyD family secretion protein
VRRALLLLVLAAGGCELDPAVDHAVGTLERDRIELRGDSDEPLVALPVTEGDRVAAGDVVAVQDDRLARADLEAAEARAAAAGAALEEAVAGARRERVRAVRARLEGARSDLVVAEAALRRIRDLAARGFAAADRVDELEGAAERARAARDALAAELDELLAGTRSEIVTRLRDEARAAQQAVFRAALAVERTRLTAPVPGIVEVLPFEVGERPPRGATVAALLADGRLYARVFVPEPLRAGLEVGDAATVRVEGEAGTRAGRVHWIAAEAAYTPFYALTQQDASRLAWAAEIDVLEPAGLSVGVPVSVTFPAP